MNAGQVVVQQVRVGDEVQTPQGAGIVCGSAAEKTGRKRIIVGPVEQMESPVFIQGVGWQVLPPVVWSFYVEDLEVVDEGKTDHLFS